MSSSSLTSLQLRETTSDGVITDSTKPDNHYSKRLYISNLRNKINPFGRTRDKLVRLLSCFGATCEPTMESTSPRKAEERIASNVFSKNNLTDRQKVFYDRIEAGNILAHWLQQDWMVAALPTIDGVQLDAIVYGIPSGGIPVAATIATQLKLPLQVAVVSKILLPWNTEVGCGAVSFRQTVKWNEPFLHSIGLSKERLQKQMEEALTKVNRRTKALGGVPTIPTREENTAVILVDDGLASGWTMTLAIEEFRKMGAKNIVVVVPTGSYDVVLKIAKIADVVFCANIRREPSFAVAAAYENWYDEREEEMVQLIRSLNNKSCYK
ncbi:Uncharacterized protein Gasu2_08810 [Galdieria sulphuraria]|uniref:Phosphoribosyltransferase n=1 Tax=Galdieria sulphuraria TaxID=130081 RepID=M2WU91_GALSU|nr:phosphoribosyltransferase [Galdieria sulphuraria]EME27480.1 phosphoribosyltransferase [Galdieria sulphuraria]GJD06465.1 Uncharacterized protein Gasu2_08810 [Galdieria sulphuraria]|eukprot:XP_005704000.1 phosphoribosyltransferase [Galdieria sulphuraria]